MKNKKLLFIIVAVCISIFIIVLTYWTVLPRQGTLELPGEGIYTGQLRGMTFHGYGTWISYEIKGVSYEGEWKDGSFHGEGTLTFYDGSQIIGQFEQGNLVGMGKSINADGVVREVNFDEIIGNEHSSCCGHDHSSECDHDH